MLPDEDHHHLPPNPYIERVIYNNNKRRKQNRRLTSVNGQAAARLRMARHFRVRCKPGMRQLTCCLFKRDLCWLILCGAGEGALPAPSPPQLSFRFAGCIKLLCHVPQSDVWGFSILSSASKNFARLFLPFLSLRQRSVMTTLKGPLSLWSH